jgi:hypothetical protein
MIASGCLVLLSKTGLVACRIVNVSGMTIIEVGMHTHGAVALSEEQQEELSNIAQSRCLPAVYVFRARLIVLPSEGESFQTIQQQLGTTAPTITRSKSRFLQSGMDGLDTNHPAQSDCGFAGQNPFGDA